MMKMRKCKKEGFFEKQKENANYEGKIIFFPWTWMVYIRALYCYNGIKVSYETKS